MRFLLVLAVGAGCGFNVRGGNSADDTPPDDAGSDGTVGMDVPIDMPIDMPIDPPGDQDGDTIVDAQDNCVAVINTNQRNHDNDPFGDACDRCPHLFSQTDPDGDGDGVGDACDPQPSNNVDRFRGWYPFDDATEINGWLAQGIWSVSGGYLVQTSTGLVGIAPPMIVNAPFAMTEAVIDDPNTNFEIGLSVPVASGTALECALVKNGVNVNIRARDQIANSSGTTLTWPGANGVGDRVRFSLGAYSDVDCRAVQGASNIHPIAGTNADPTGRTYVGAVGVEVRFDYLFVVDQAP